MKYEIIIFDADDTLFDFKKAEKEAFKNTMFEFNIEYDEDYHLREYSNINTAIWKEFEKGLITQEELKVERFKRFSKKLKIEFDEIEFADSYTKNLSFASFLYDDSIELIENLHKDYRLTIITNGLTEVQHKRIRNSIIGRYFEEVVISEEVGAAKPDIKIFEHALNKINYTDKRKVLMVGDSLSSDIKGGINFGIDTCWFNPEKAENKSGLNPTYEITKLTLLKNILEQ